VNDPSEGHIRNKRRFVGIIPIGPVPAIASEVIVSYLQTVCHLKAVILPELPEPAYAHDALRKQFNAALIIERLETIPRKGCLKLIGILNVDLFLPIFTHVFGEAREGGRCGIVSMFRLRKRDGGMTPSQDLILERTAKVAIHELGHLFLVPHCADRACLMHFSMDLTELDAIPIRFCRYCQAFFRSAVQRA